MGRDSEDKSRKLITAEEFMVVIGRTWFEAQAASLNFTGGELTLSNHRRTSSSARKDRDASNHPTSMHTNSKLRSL